MSGEPPFDLEVEDLARRLGEAEPPLLLDIREPWETRLCALPDSLFVPMGELPARLSDLPRHRPLVVICHHGIRSRQATLWLRHHGVGNAVNLVGGLDAWALRVDPTIGRY